MPIAGTGAGLRPIGQDPNFVEDFREIFNISVPIHQNEDEIDQVSISSMFYEHLFCTKVFSSAFLELCFSFGKSTKALLYKKCTGKMLMKLTAGVNIYASYRSYKTQSRNLKIVICYRIDSLVIQIDLCNIQTNLSL
jgi:hypothetical protein